MTGNYFVDSLSKENYSIVEADGNSVLTLTRCSRQQAEAIRDAMEYTHAQGKKGAGSFSEGFDHGAAVGVHETEETAYQEGYAAGRLDYHNELWARGESLDAE